MTEDSGNRQLSVLLNLEALDEELWHDDELGAIYRHQLATPLAIDLAPGVAEPEVMERTTFGDVIFSNTPSRNLLAGIKDFSKAQAQALPKTVSGVLYVCALVCAAANKLDGFTSLDEASKVDWAQKQPWLDDRTNEFLARF